MVSRYIFNGSAVILSKAQNLSISRLLVLSRSAVRPKNHAARPQTHRVRAAITVYLMVVMVRFTIVCTCSGSGA
jgi:hypothetical protein